MRGLTARQAFNCETAREPRCACRCGGALHGARRGGVAAGAAVGSAEEIDHAFFERLPPEDPHHLPTDAERRRAARQRKMQRRFAAAREGVAQLRLRWGEAS